MTAQQQYAHTHRGGVGGTHRIVMWTKVLKVAEAAEAQTDQDGETKDD